MIRAELCEIALGVADLAAVILTAAPARPSPTLPPRSVTFCAPWPSSSMRSSRAAAFSPAATLTIGVFAAPVAFVGTPIQHSVGFSLSTSGSVTSSV